MGITLWKQLTEVIGTRQAFLKVANPFASPSIFACNLKLPYLRTMKLV